MFMLLSLFLLFPTKEYIPKTTQTLWYPMLFIVIELVHTILQFFVSSLKSLHRVDSYTTLMCFPCMPGQFLNIKTETMKIICFMITDTFVFHERSTSDIIKCNTIPFELINECSNISFFSSDSNLMFPIFKNRSISYHRRNAFTIDNTIASSSKHSNNKSSISGPASTNLFTSSPFKELDCLSSRNNTPSGQKVSNNLNNFSETIQFVEQQMNVDK